MRPNLRSPLPYVALGASLARRGPMAIVAIVISITTALLAIVVAIALGLRPKAPVHDIPILTSSALAWGGGFLHAFTVAAGAVRRDHADGVMDLLTTRTTTTRGYMLGRVGGLSAVLAATVGGGTLLVGAVSILGAHEGGGALRVALATLAAVVYALAFSVAVAPLAFAILGARTRWSGYLVFLAVLFGPELLASMASSTIPSELTEIFSLPSALGALRSSLSPGTVDLLRVLRAAASVVVWTLGATLIVRRDIAIVESEAEAS